MGELLFHLLIILVALQIGLC